ncbi:hypothetical protein C355_05926 [Cryptococcus neoformans Th84]|nr:hypothetical protein C355_05926 [Cryptococcus neoformans var. grubii Th84]OXH24542.1 hypothetical protein J009_05971 [Cryptococcus neoformans var. grubii]OXH65073.1 hypothetical protein J000_05963 [Cryptococcus neoformans var. grubii]
MTTPLGFSLIKYDFAFPSVRWVTALHVERRVAKWRLGK